MFHLSDVGAQLRRIARDAIDDSLLEGAVLSTRDLDELFEEWSRDFSYEISELDNEDLHHLREQIHGRFVDSGEVYKSGDWKSYETAVRSQGLISVQEMMLSANIRQARVDGREILIGVTEFSIDDDGYYVEPVYLAENKEQDEDDEL